MIVAYAQAADREGLVAAADGESATSGDARLVELREKAISLNFSTTPHRSGDVEVRYGKGIVRVELAGADGGETILSPIVVVADAAELLEGRDDAIRRATESVTAIGRQCDVQAIEVGFAMGDLLHRSARTRRRVVTAVAVSVAAVSIVLLTRGCARSGALFGLIDSWPVR